MNEFLVVLSTFILLMLISFFSGSSYQKRKISKRAKIEFKQRQLSMMQKIKPIGTYNFFPGSWQSRPILPWLCNKHSAIDTIYLSHDIDQDVFEIIGASTRNGHTNEVDPFPISINYSYQEDASEIIKLGEAIISIGKLVQIKKIT